MPKDDVLKVIDSQSSSRSNVGSFVVSNTGGGGSGGVSPTELENYLKRDGTAAMLGPLDMGGFNVTNVTLLDGIDLPAHVANQDAHHPRAHAYNSTDHTGFLSWGKIDFSGSNLTSIQTRLHSSLQSIGPNDHHNQVHGILGSDHTVAGAAYDLVGLTAVNTLGLHTPSSNPGASIKILMTDSTGFLKIKRLEGTDYVKSSAYLQAATYVTAGSYVSAISHVDAPLLQYSGNLSITAGINLFLNPTGYVSFGVASGKPLRSPSFTSGFLGDGWQIDQGTSAPGTNAEFDNLTIRGRMRVYELIIQKIRATNGSVFVSSVGKVATATNTTGDTWVITTDDVHGFFVQDLIRAQQFTGNTPNPIYRCDMRVTVVTDTKTFTAVRENGSDTPKAGMDFVRLGSTSNASRRGGVYMTSDDSNAPFIDVFDGVDSWTAWTDTGKVKVRIGKITGVTSVANEYGIIAGASGFGPTNSWFKASNLGVVLNNIPLQFFNGVARTGYWNPTGTEFYIGVNTGDRRLDWNGSVLTVKGAITVQAGSTGIGTFADAGGLATANNLDDVPDGATSKKTTANEKTGAARAYSAINSSGNVIAKFDPSSAWGANPGAGFTGLLLGSDYMGYWDGAAWRTYMDNSGKFFLNSGSPTNYLSWNGTSLTISGTVSIIGGSGWGNFSDVPDRYVTVPTAGTPAGLYITSTNMGYWNGSVWKTWMTSGGSFFFGGNSGASIRWNGTKLSGYNGSNIEQWYGSATDGKFYTGGGAVVLSSSGIQIEGGFYGFTDTSPEKAITWKNGALNFGSIGGGEMDLFGYSGGVEIASWGIATGRTGTVRISSKLYNSNTEMGNTEFNSGNITSSGNLTAENVIARKEVSGKTFNFSDTTASKIGDFSGLSNANNYTFFNLNYNGTRMGYLLWGTDFVRLLAEGRYLTLYGSRVGVNRIDPSYTLDVSGEFRATGSVRADVALSLLPQSTPPTPSAAYGILYVNASNQLCYIKKNATGAGTVIVP
jgi:hypothetical protein